MQVNNIIKKLDRGELTLKDFSKKTDISLENAELIGSGAVGKVYLLGDKLVVKEVLPCNAPIESALYRYCENVLDLPEKIPFIPGGNGKIRYSLPNLLSEITVGMVLGRMKESVNFTRTLNSEIKDRRQIYILMDAEKQVVNNLVLSPELKINQNNPKTFIYMLFQISHAIMTAQEKHKMTHYDLHIENILWNDWSDDKSKDKRYISYPLPNRSERVVIPKSYCPFILKISDFALSRLETKNALVTPLIENFPEKTYGEFNPSYDIMSLIGTILIDNKYRVAFDELFNNLDIYKFMLIFSLWVLNDKEIKLNRNANRFELDRIRDQIGNKYYTSIGTIENKFNFRPKKEGDFVKYGNAKSMIEVVNFLGRVLEAKNYAIFSDAKSDKVLYLERLAKYKKYDSVNLFIPEIKLRKTPDIEKTLGNYVEMRIDEYMMARSYHVLTNLPPKEYNFTVDQKQLDNCPIQEHYMAVIFVDKNFYEKYKFSFDCCKLDPGNYMMRNNKVGFSMNGGFFAVKDDFLPIGKYKDNYNTIDKYPIPEKYKSVYRYIVLENNRLKIKKRWNKKDNVFSTGPVLIENGKIVFDPEDVKFSCTDEKNSWGNVISVSEDTITTSGHYKYSTIEDNGFSCVKEFVPEVKEYPRCDRIQPGELSHADNPNPRSCLAILKNGDYMFVTVEGRGNRGVGFDLYTLSKSLLKSFPNIETLVNLDGGRSSVMAWRTEKEKDKIYISNPDRLYAYPVGNILSLLEK